MEKAAQQNKKSSAAFLKNKRCFFGKFDSKKAAPFVKERLF